MMYYNTVLHYGLEAFAEKCAKVGVDGLIIPDLPLEEQQPLKRCTGKTECNNPNPAGSTGIR